MELGKKLGNLFGSRKGVAVFFDYENFALAFRTRSAGKRPDLAAVMEHARSLSPRRRVDAAFAYADWSHFEADKQEIERERITPVQVNALPVHGKNATDIQMAVDMIDRMHDYTGISTYLLVTGDSDFAPVAQRLRDHGHRVVGIGVQGSVSARLRDACDEFLDYENLLASRDSSATKPARRPKRPQPKRTPRKSAFSSSARETLKLADGYAIPAQRLIELLPLASEACESARPQHISEMRKALSLRFPGKMSAQETATLANLLFAVGAFGGKSGGWLRSEQLRDGQFAFDLLLAVARDTLSESEKQELGGLPQMVQLITGEQVDPRELEMRLSRGKQALAEFRENTNGSAT